jgi:hypothetical protein
MSTVATAPNQPFRSSGKVFQRSQFCRNADFYRRSGRWDCLYRLEPVARSSQSACNFRALILPVGPGVVRGAGI